MRRWAWLVAGGLLVAGCDFQRAYDDYCVRHPGDCAGSSDAGASADAGAMDSGVTDGGALDDGGAVDAGTMDGGADVAVALRLSVDSPSAPARDCITGSFWSVTAGGANGRLVVPGSVFVTASPAGLGFIAGEGSCVDSSSPMVGRDYAQGTVLNDRFRLRPNLAGTFTLTMTTTTGLPVEQDGGVAVTFPGRLEIVGLPPNAPVDSCLPAEVQLLDTEGGLVAPNRWTRVDLDRMNTEVFDATDCDGGHVVATFGLDGGARTRVVFVKVKAGGSTLTASAPPHLSVTARTEVPGQACLQPDAGCLALDGGVPCCAGSCRPNARGRFVCGP
jgi:hypothetical protein